MLSAVTENPYMQTPLNIKAGYRAQDKPWFNITVFDGYLTLSGRFIRRNVALFGNSRLEESFDMRNTIEKEIPYILMT